jgi:Helix-turn-helix domain
LDENLFTESEVAHILFRDLISVRTLQAWRQQHRGPAFLKLGRRVLYRREDVLAYLQRSAVATEVPPSLADVLRKPTA